MSIVLAIIFAVLLFSIIIFLHELGHFLAAKAFHVQVNEFALFMGPAVFKKQIGETLYSIRCIPFGGYCAMEGEDNESDNPRAFGRAKWWKRLIILIAGAGMNFITGVLLMAIVYAPVRRFAVPVIAQAEEGCAIVREDGLHVGDRFLEVDGEKIYVASDFSMILSLNGGETHDFVIERNGEKLTFSNYRMEKKEFPNEDGTTLLRYGITLGDEEATFGNKIGYIWNQSIDCVRTVRLSLQMLVTGKAGFQDMTGPVGITKQFGQIASQSDGVLSATMNMLYFGAFIAINLAVMNLLPIPALDGGRAVCLLLTTAVEGITKKKINPKYEGYLHSAGMVLLLILMVVITFKDVFYIFKG